MRLLHLDSLMVDLLTLIQETQLTVNMILVMCMDMNFGENEIGQ